MTKAEIVSADVTEREWYIALVDDCKAIVTEAVFTSRWSLVEGYHALGERINADPNYTKWEQGKAGRVLQGLAKDIGTSTRTIHYARQFHEKFPALDELPGGKNTSWTKVTKLLPEPPKPKTPPLPDGKFSVIYADPPWPVESIEMEKWKSTLDHKYETLTLKEIGALPVIEHSADECSLFLWTTHTFLPDAFDIIKAWGFKYFCCITWNKGSGWTQNGFHKMTEFLLYAYKGTMNVEDSGKAIPTLIAERKGEHSKKPDSIRDLIKSKTPEPRLEMFARETHPGWTVWGNEV
jgi:N6-adenosine-specific RNA methylase IME4